MNFKEKKILIADNVSSGVLRGRSNHIKTILNEGGNVVVVAPKDKTSCALEEMGCKFVDFPIDARGVNLIRELKTYFSYVNVLKEERPDLVLTFSTKPNIYCTLACKKLGIKYITNITGRGTALGNSGVIQRVMIMLLRRSLTNASCVFFQNANDRQFFLNNKIGKLQSYRLIPGSGVDLVKYKLTPYPSPDVKEINFLFISRLLKQKGIEEYIDAADIIRREHPECTFHVLGDSTPECDMMVNDANEKGIINFHGRVNNVGDFIINSHCTIHPSYYPEGMANVILESAAVGRPVITTDHPGCREGVDNGITGFIIAPHDTNSLVSTIKKFLHLSYEEKKAMGIAGRRKMEKEFDREFVTMAYKNEINTVLHSK